jgi:hypothetical protein
MINSGITLNRIRCSDFFRQRGAGQTTGRIARAAIPPLSALITSILGIVDFDADDDRQQAIQILGLSIAATEGTLRVYEEEFLFGAENIRAVELLTLRDLDTHAQQVLDRGSGYYQALRDLLDHQSRCRPTAILELSQTAIREGRVRPRDTGAGNANGRAALSPEEQQALAQFSGSLGPSLSINQLGALWWLLKDRPTDVRELAVIRNRLGPVLSARFLDPTTNALVISSADSAILTALEAAGGIPAPTLQRFAQIRNLLRTAVAQATLGTAVEATRDISFAPASSIRQLNGGAVETGVTPAEEPNDK